MPQKKFSGIYVISNRISGGFYVGSSIHVLHRIDSHLHELRHGKHKNSHLRHAFDKYGEAAFHCEVIALIDGPDLHAVEQRLLDRLVGHPRCYNLSRDATAPRRGVPLTLAQRAHLSALMMGKRLSPESEAKRIASRAGYRHSEETKAKIRESNRLAKRGKALTPEHCAAISAGMLASSKQIGRIPGFTTPPETRAKMSVSLRRHFAKAAT